MDHLMEAHQTYRIIYQPAGLASVHLHNHCLTICYL
jgi:hypothetical protein